MSNFEDKINAILGNPAEMEKLTRLASQFLGGGREQEAAPPQAEKPDMSGLLDPDMLSKISRLMSSSGNSDKTALLRAMGPYMSEERREKLEKAMRFARLAKVAGAMFGEFGGDGDV